VTDEHDGVHPARFRYGAVLVLVLVTALLVFLIVAPAASWSRAVAVALLWCGTGPDSAAAREQWTLRDIVPLVLGHFGV